MKKRFLAMFLALVMCLALLPAALAAEQRKGYKLTLEYDSTMCSMKAKDWYTNQSIENGGIIYEDTTAKRAYAEITIENIKDGYRIKDLMIGDINYGISLKASIIDGHYGSIAIPIMRDTTFKLELEPVPDQLPVVSSVAVYLDEQCTQKAGSTSFGPENFRLFAQAVSTTEGAIPSYYAKYLWEYSTDGGNTWKEAPGWGYSSSFNADWYVYEQEYHMNFMTMKDYLLRVRAESKEFYSNVDGGKCYSDPVSINSSNPSTPPAPTVPSATLPTVEKIPAKGTAVASTQTVKLDGKDVQFQYYAVKDAKGNESNYVKVRDLANALNGTKAQFNVGWDGKISIVPNTAYEVKGGEGTTPYSGDQPYTSVSDTPVSFNGKAVNLTSFQLKDSAGNGYTYYKLRDLGQLLGFNVKWDNSAKSVVIETDKPFTGN